VTDRTELERPADRPAPPSSGPSPTAVSDPDHAAWRVFAEAATPEAFYRGWLAVQCRQVPGALSGVVVLSAPDTGRYAPAAFWPEGRRNVRHLAEVAERALTERRGLVIPRPRPAGDAATTRARYDVAFPIEVEGRLHGVVALDVVPRQERDLQTVLRQLQWGASWLEVLVLRDEIERTAAVRDRLATVLDLVPTGFGHESARAGATALLTAVATRLGCDRVSLGFVRGGRARVHAMSHTAQFGKGSNLVRAIGSAMDEAIDQAAPVVHPPPAGWRPQVSRMHGELAHQHGSGSVCSIPFAEGTEFVGALTLERPADQPFDAASLELVEALVALAGPVLELQRRDDRWLVAKAGDSVRKTLGALVGPRHLVLKLATVAAAAAVAFLAVAEGDFRVAGSTALEPVIRRAAVAPFAGYVAEAPVRAGDVVRRGQLLVRLDDRDLRLERAKAASQHEQLTREHSQALAARNAAQFVILSARLDQSRAQLALLDDHLTRTRVEAPFDGILVAGDLSQHMAAPVERGQLLYEIAPLDAYRLVIKVDERDVTLVAPGQQGTLVLAGVPGEPLGFTVEKVTPVSTPKDARNFFRVEAALHGTLDRLRPGMEGVGKIEVGRRLHVWIWTRQVIDWLRLQVWTWMP
jgi:RND family efflux transporter MFP subunit